MASGMYDLVVLDEINSTQNLGMLTAESVLDALANKADATEVILTGRNPAQEFLDAAHLITEMRLDRHYFYSGVPAREGLDY
jgi:cob(I)alamin adenosyltransferase